MSSDRAIALSRNISFNDSRNCNRGMSIDAMTTALSKQLPLRLSHPCLRALNIEVTLVKNDCDVLRHQA